MPLGSIRIRRIVRPPPDDPKKKSKKVIIRPPRVQPVRILVQPKPRPGVKQYTVIRYDNEGQYFVDEFVERLNLGGVADDRRLVRHVVCPRYQFSVALAVCHRYCALPCTVHIETIKTLGWFKPGGTPK